LRGKSEPEREIRALGPGVTRKETTEQGRIPTDMHKKKARKQERRALLKGGGCVRQPRECKKSSPKKKDISGEETKRNERSGTGKCSINLENLQENHSSENKKKNDELEEGGRW